MKTKLFLIALAFGLMSSTCTPEEQEVNGCVCKKVYYDYGIIAMQGASPQWGYIKVDEESATETDCNLDTGEYIQVDSNTFYKIECE